MLKLVANAQLHVAAARQIRRQRGRGHGRLLEVRQSLGRNRGNGEMPVAPAIAVDRFRERLDAVPEDFEVLLAAAARESGGLAVPLQALLATVTCRGLFRGIFRDRGFVGAEQRRHGHGRRRWDGFVTIRCHCCHCCLLRMLLLLLSRHEHRFWRTSLCVSECRDGGYSRAMTRIILLLLQRHGHEWQWWSNWRIFINVT